MTDAVLVTKEDMETIMSSIKSMENLLKIIVRNTKLPQVVTIADIAEIEGLSVTNLKEKHPELLPNFGVSDYGTGTKRWAFDTYQKWQQIPVAQRKKMYQNHLLNGCKLT